MGPRPVTPRRARLGRPALLAVLGAALVLSLARPPEAEPLAVQPTLSVLDLLTTPTYTVRTTLRQPDGTLINRRYTGIIGVPTLVDTGKSALLPSVDLLVTILPRLPLGVGLTINRFPLAPLQPVKVEVDLRLPTQANNGVTFGYDALETRSPAVFDANLQVGLQPGSTDLGLTASIQQAPTALDLLASLYTRGPNGTDERVDPLDVVLGATPVPSTLTASTKLTPGLLGFGDADVRDVVAHVAAPAPFHADVHVDRVKGDDRTSIDADVPSLPVAVDVTLHQERASDITTVALDTPGGIAAATADAEIVDDGDEPTTAQVEVVGVPSHVDVGLDSGVLAGDPATTVDDVERTTVTWGANGPLTRAEVTADGRTAKDVPFHLEGAIDELPGSPPAGGPGLTVDIDKVGPAPDPGAPDLRTMRVEARTPEAGAPVGTVDAAFALDGADLPRLDTTAPAYGSVVTTDAGFSAVAARLHDVTFAELDTADPILVDVRATHDQAFDLAFDSAKVDVDAQVRNLPATATVTIDTPEGDDPETTDVVEPDVTTLGYTGGAVIADVDAVVEAITGSGVTSTSVVHVDEVPTELEVELTDGPGDHHEVVVDANGRVRHVDADTTTTNAAGQPVHLVAHLDDLPAELTAVFEKLGPAPAPGALDTRALSLDAFTGLDPAVTADVLDPALRIGAVDATLTIGDVEPPPPGVLDAYGSVLDTGDELAVAAAVTDLTRLTLRAGDPLVLDVRVAEPLPFAIDVDTPSVDVVGTIHDLTTDTHLSIDTPEDDDPATEAVEDGVTVVDYRGATGIASVDAIVGAVTSDGATFDGHLLLQGVPTTAKVTLTDDRADDALTAVYTGGPIDHVNVSDASFDPAGAGGPVDLTADVLDVPPWAMLVLDSGEVTATDVPAYPHGASRKVLTWSAAGPTGHLTATADLDDADGESVHVAVDLDALPAAVAATVDKVGPKPPAGGPDDRKLVAEVATPPGVTIGEADFALSLRDVALPPFDPSPHATVVDQGDGALAVRAHATGITQVKVDTRDPLVLEATFLESMKFGLDVTTPSITVVGTLDELPTHAVFSLATPPRTSGVQTTVVDYTGQDGIKAIDATVSATTDDGDTFDGTVALDGAPSAAKVTLVDDRPSDRFEATYVGGAIGQVNVTDATFDPAGGAPPIGLTADARQLPGNATLVLQGSEVLPDDANPLLPEGGSRQEVTWTADAPTGPLTASADLVDADGEPIHVDLALDALPSGIRALVDRPGPRPPAGEIDERETIVAVATLPDAAGVVTPIGRADFGVRIGAGAVIPAALSADASYASLDTRTGTAAAARVLGLKSVRVDTRDPFVLDATLLAPVPFDLQVRTDDLTIDQAAIRNLPAVAHVTFDAPEKAELNKTTVFGFDNDAGIATIHLHARARIDVGEEVDATVDLVSVPADGLVTVVDGFQQEIHWLGGPIGQIHADVSLLTKDDDGVHETTIDGHLTGVPTEVNVVSQRLALGFNQITGVEYDASGPLQKLDVALAPADAATMHAVLQSIPTEVSIGHIVSNLPPIDLGPVHGLPHRRPADDDNTTAPKHPFTLDVDTNGAIGLTTVTMTEPGSAELTVPPAPVKAIHLGQPLLRPNVVTALVQHLGGNSLLRMPAIESVHVRSANPLELRLSLDEELAPFVPLDVEVDLDDGTTIDASLDALPHETDLTLDLTGGVVRYEGSSTIDEIEAVVHAPEGDLLGDDGMLSRLTYLQLRLESLPRGVAIGFGQLADGGAGIAVEPFTPDPDPTVPSGSTNPLLDIDFPVLVPNIPPLLDATIGGIDLIALERQVQISDELPEAGVVFEETKDNGRLALRIRDVQQAGFRIRDITPSAPEADGATEITAHLEAGGRGHAPSAQDQLFELIVENQTRLADGAPVNCFSHTDVQLGGLPQAVDVRLVTEGGGDSTAGSTACGRVLDPVLASQEAWFSENPTSLGLQGYRYNGTVNTPAAHFDDKIVEIANPVSRNFLACSARFTGRCTDLGEWDEGPTHRVSGEDVPYKGRRGSSLRIVSSDAMTVSKFIECDSGCNLDQEISKPELSQTAEFTRLYGLQIPEIGDSRGGLDMDTFTPTNDNGLLIDDPGEIGLLGFDTDGHEITITGVEKQTFDHSGDCTASNRKPTRTGMGELTGKVLAAPLIFAASNRVVWFNSTSIDVRDGHCTSLGFQCRERRGAMFIRSGEIIAQANGFLGPIVSSLNKELAEPDGCEGLS